MIGAVVKTLSRIITNVDLAIARAIFGTIAGIVMALGFFYLIIAFTGWIGFLLQWVFDKIGFRAISGLGLVLIAFLLCLDVIVLIMMFIGRFALQSDQADDETMHSAFEVLFLFYGCFITCTIFLVYGYYTIDPSIFKEINVGFWKIALYVFDLSVRGLTCNQS